MLAAYSRERGSTGSPSTLVFQMLSGGNTGHPTIVGPLACASAGRARPGRTAPTPANLTCLKPREPTIKIPSSADASRFDDRLRLARVKQIMHRCLTLRG